MSFEAIQSRLAELQRIEEKAFEKTIANMSEIEKTVLYRFREVQQAESEAAEEEFERIVLYGDGLGRRPIGVLQARCR